MGDHLAAHELQAENAGYQQPQQQPKVASASSQLQADARQPSQQPRSPQQPDNTLAAQSSTAAVRPSAATEQAVSVRGASPPRDVARIEPLPPPHLEAQSPLYADGKAESAQHEEQAVRLISEHESAQAESQQQAQHVPLLGAAAATAAHAHSALQSELSATKRQQAVMDVLPAAIADLDLADSKPAHDVQREALAGEEGRAAEAHGPEPAQAQLGSGRADDQHVQAPAASPMLGHTHPQAQGAEPLPGAHL